MMKFTRLPVAATFQFKVIRTWEVISIGIARIIHTGFLLLKRKMIIKSKPETNSQRKLCLVEIVNPSGPSIQFWDMANPMR